MIIETNIPLALIFLQLPLPLQKFKDLQGSASDSELLCCRPLLFRLSWYCLYVRVGVCRFRSTDFREDSFAGLFGFSGSFELCRCCRALRSWYCLYVRVGVNRFRSSDFREDSSTALLDLEEFSEDLEVSDL